MLVITVQVVLGWISLQLCSTVAQDTSSCKEYVPEGGTFDCTCLERCSSGDKPVRTWPGHNNTDRLVKSNIARQQDGDQFVCQTVCGSQATNTTYTLRVAYGPENSTSNVSGPQPFTTNGTMVMTMTCNTTTNPTPEYSWFNVICHNGNAHSTCNFIPALGDDGKHVECEVTNTKINPPKKATVGFSISLYYPPTDAPAILNYKPPHVIKSGDTLTCKVNDSKPVVNVTFNCSDPHHEDQGDILVGREVYSFITVNTSSVTKNGENMTCYCSGHWSPEPCLYPPERYAAYATYYTQYLPELITFTINATDTETLTLNESDHTTLTLQCSAYGRPAPRVSLLKDETKEIVRNAIADEFQFTQTISHVLQPAECQDTGTYTCHASNGSHSFDSKTFRLTVNCRLSSASIGAIAGVAVAAGAFLVIIVVVIIVCCKKRRAGENSGNRIQADRQEKQNPCFEMEIRAPEHDGDNRVVANGIRSPRDPTAKADPTLATRLPPDNAGYGDLNDLSTSAQLHTILRKKSARATAYEITSVASTGKFEIKREAAPQPNHYAESWDRKKPFIASVRQGFPADDPAGSNACAHNVPAGPGPKGYIDARAAKQDKGDKTQAKGEKGKRGHASGNTATGGPPFTDMTSPQDDSHTYDHFTREGHRSTPATQEAETQYSHIGDVGKVRECTGETRECTQWR